MNAHQLYKNQINSYTTQLRKAPPKAFSHFSIQSEELLCYYVMFVYVVRYKNKTCAAASAFYDNTSVHIFCILTEFF